MSTLKEKFQEASEPQAVKIKEMLKENGDLIVGQVTVAQMYGGMRGIRALVTETSSLDPERGIRFRGYPIPELKEKLPKAKGGVEPLPEGLLYLMMVGELPTDEDVTGISKDLSSRADVPADVFKTIDALPIDTHPMTQFSIAVMAMQSGSIFAKAYRDGVHKSKLWDPM